MMLSFDSMILLAALAASSSGGAAKVAAASSFRRSLSEDKIAGYEPMTDVTEHKNLDLDQLAIENYLEGQSIQSFTYARNVYDNGGYSKSVASITLDSPLTISIPKGTRIGGTSASGGDVALVSYADYDPDDEKIDVQYVTDGCNVGGLNGPNTVSSPLDLGNTGDQSWGGCLAQSGSITVETSSIPYTYSLPDDNWNGRTIAGFSTSADSRMRPDEDTAPYFPDFQKFVDYYGDADYANKWVVAALTGQDTDFKSGKGDANFGLYGQDYVARAEGVKKGTSYMAVLMYTIRELEDAIYDCELGCDREECNDDAVHALDEAVAFYAGSLEGAAGSSGEGVFPYALADKRAANFKTAGINGGEAEGKAKVNFDIFKQFSAMQDKLKKKDCTGARAHKERISQLIFVPLIQGTLRYAFITSTDPTSGTKAEAEGATFAAGVLPVVAACSPDDADTIYENMKVGQGGNADFAAVKAAFESNYACMGIGCSDVGGLWDDAQQSYEEGAAPCSGAGSVGARFGLSVAIAAGLTLASFFVL